MRNTRINKGQARSGAGAITTVALTLLLAACGGSENSPAAVAQQRDEAAALQHAMQLAKSANSAQVRGERATAAAQPGK